MKKSKQCTKEKDTATLKAMAQVVVEAIRPIQDKYNELINSPELDEILDKGAEKANRVAFKQLRKVENAMGLSRKRR